MRVIMDDVRRAGHCAEGLKDFCEMHNLSLRELVYEGWKLEDLKRVKDANLDLVLEQMRIRVAQEESADVVG